MGEALARSVECRDPWAAFFEIERLTNATAPEPSSNNATTILVEANNTAAEADRHAAVVFPLMNVADAAEDCLRRALGAILAPAAPKKSRARGKKEKLGGKGMASPFYKRRSTNAKD
jgi:hypothetical protein